VAGSGVAMRETLIVARARTAAPWWRELLPAWREAPRAELPAGATHADLAQVPVAEMPLYLPFLERQAQALGVTFERREVHSLAEALAEADVVVNCTGLGAREVAGDERLFPIRGQVVSVARGATRCVVDDDNDGGVTYVVPRSRDVVLGGTSAVGDTSLAPRADETAAIHARCAELVPSLREAEISGVRVGLRPGRDAVRLEVERFGEQRVVHNYGHGGCGMTLSWGCADEVVDLLSG
jgi:D-amino-acid oxidase